MTIARMHAGGNRYDTRCQGGGNKLAGMAPRATGFMLSVPFAHSAALGKAGRATALAIKKDYTFPRTNQIGSIASRVSQTQAPSDGVRKPVAKCTK